jgi:hypothetical protein
MSFDEDDTEEVKPFLFPLFRCFYTNLPFASLHLGTPSATGQSNNILLVQSIEMKVQKALDCPCVADLKNGPCGGQFVDAFSCFLRSTEEEKVAFLFFYFSASNQFDFNLNVPNACYMFMHIDSCGMTFFLLKT